MKNDAHKTGVHTGHWLGFWLMSLVVLSWTPLAKAEPVCARVKIEIQQELILERQAFAAMMKINNNLDTLAIDNVRVSVNFKDDAGNSVVATSNPNNTYDRNNQQTQVIRPEGGVTQYSYDSASQIATMTDAKGQQARYSNDDAGRITTIAYYSSATDATPEKGSDLN